jgi:hypothetical protein
MGDTLASFFRSNHAALPRPTVELLHSLPDGTHHVDWLIASDALGQRPLLTFRLPRGIEDMTPDEPVEILRLADHRPHYLDYEGPISGDRGSVRRLWRGVVTAVTSVPGGMWPSHEISMRSAGRGLQSQIVVRLQCIGGARWWLDRASLKTDDSALVSMPPKTAGKTSVGSKE